MFRIFCICIQGVLCRCDFCYRNCLHFYCRCDILGTQNAAHLVADLLCSLFADEVKLGTADLGAADELDLVATGGSDFHGEMNPSVRQPGVILPAAIGERLCAWLGVAA